MKTNNEFLITIKNLNPIEIVISSYVKLKKRGRNFICNCPFHSEKTPSFTVFPESQSFYCFGCGIGGDIFTFVKMTEHLDFVETIKFLAQKSGLEVPDYNNKNSQQSYRMTRIYEMNRIAAKFFYNSLVKGSDKSGLKYFYSRNISLATIKKYGLGYSPNTCNKLVDILNLNGYSEEEIIAAGLGRRSQKSNKIFDVFRYRVIFPIINLNGNVIGFGGRVLDNSKPKYLNTSNTLVFDKSTNLFSLNFAKKSESKRLILCEGYMDVITINQAGFKNVVATLGTGINPQQARIISHYADEVVIAYDNDRAGQNAILKAIKYFSDIGLKTKIIRMEGAKDPDEYIRKFDASHFKHLIDNSDSAKNFLLDCCEYGININTEFGKVELMNRISRFLAGISSLIEREIYIARTAKKYDFPSDVLKQVINNLIRKRTSFKRNIEERNMKINTYNIHYDINHEAAKCKKEAKAEEIIICYLLRHIDESEIISINVPPDIFITTFNRRVYTAILNTAKNLKPFDFSVLNNEFSTVEMSRISGIIAKNNDISIHIFNDCVNVLKKYRPVDNDLSIKDLQNMFYKKKA